MEELQKLIDWIEKYDNENEILPHPNLIKARIKLRIKELKQVKQLNTEDVSNILPPLNTVRQEIDKYEETMQNSKGHFQNGINWGLNYIAKKIKK